MAYEVKEHEEAIFMIEEADNALPESEIQETIRSSFSMAANTGVNQVVLVYQGDRLPSIEQGFLHFGYDIAEENNAFTQAMFNHIAKVGGDVAAENAKERAVAAGRVFVKDISISEYNK